MDNNEMEAIIEGILFTMGDSVEPSKIAKALEVETKEVVECLDLMMQKYEEENRGIRLMKLDDSYQMCTSPNIYEYLIKIAKQPKKYVRIDGKEICYLPTAKQYASQFDKKASFEPRENAFVSVKISEKCDSDVMKMNPHTAIRILKVLVLWDERLWMDYARYADDKELKILFAKMDKLKKAKKNKKDNANDGVLLANIRGALLLNEHKAARAYFEQIGLLQEYEKKH